MKHVVLGVVALAIASLTVNTASAQAPKGRSDGRGFNFGGAPEFDGPPLAKDEREKRALAVLDEMSKGRWYLNVTTREGRVLRQLTEALGAKRVVEIGTSSGYSTIWLALGVRSTGGKVFTHEIDPEKVEIARANFKKAGLDVDEKALGRVIFVLAVPSIREILENLAPSGPVCRQVCSGESLGPFVQQGRRHHREAGQGLEDENDVRR